MSTFRDLGLVNASTATPTPIFTGAVVAAVSFSITKNVAKIVLGAGNLPTSGYCGPNGYPVQNATTGASLDIQGVYPAPNGNQVTLWGFTTATYFNGKTVTVLDCNPTDGSFRFYFTHADVASTADTGSTAPIPVESFRSVRLECGANNASNIVYVGDLNVSATNYAAALGTAVYSGSTVYEITGQNIRADRIFIFGSATGATCAVQVSLLT